MTKIISAEVIELNIPFDDPGKGEGLFEGAWTSHDFALLRVETDNGLIGWGEGFSYFCRATVATLMRQSIIPALVGRDPADIDLILAELRQKLHIIGSLRQPGPLCRHRVGGGAVRQSRHRRFWHDQAA